MAYDIGIESVHDFKLWKVDVLRRYCQDRSIAGGSKRKEELVALAYAAHTQKLPIILSKAGEKSAAQQQYTNLLMPFDGTVICNPLQRTSDECLSLADGGGISRSA